MGQRAQGIPRCQGGHREPVLQEAVHGGDPVEDKGGGAIRVRDHDLLDRASHGL